METCLRALSRDKVAEAPTLSDSLSFLEGSNLSSCSKLLHESSRLANQANQANQCSSRKHKLGENDANRGRPPRLPTHQPIYSDQGTALCPVASRALGDLGDVKAGVHREPQTREAVTREMASSGTLYHGKGQLGLLVTREMASAGSLYRWKWPAQGLETQAMVSSGLAGLRWTKRSEERRVGKECPV